MYFYYYASQIQYNKYNIVINCNHNGNRTNIKMYMETSAVICNGHVKGFTLLLPSVFPQIKVQFNWKGEMEKCQRDSIYCFHIRMDGQKE